MFDAKNPSQLLEQAAAQIRGAEASDAVVAAAAERVWQRLSAPHTAGAAAAAEVAEIRGCDDYQALIPAFLAGALPPARTTLLEDHVRECVPCRRALKVARSGQVPVAKAATQRARRSYPLGRMALAAVLVLGLGAGAMLLWQSMPFSNRPAATVTSLDGDLFRVAAGSLPVEVGAIVREHEHIRSGRTGGAVVTLADGSRVELRARSELSIDDSRRGTTIHLDRGSVIVQAAKQHDRKLYVDTDDCLVSVTGTIFSVNHGTKGSRVSVIEGQVRVDFSGEETVLQPGDQMTTRQSLAAMPLARELAWSRDVDRYIALLGELHALGTAIHEAVGTSELRYHSRLLEHMPAGTVFYAAVPNVSESIGDAYRAAMARLSESPALSAWWQHNHGDDRLQPAIDEIIDRFEALGSHLGDEVAVGVFRDGDTYTPLVAAEVGPQGGLRSFIEQQIHQFVTGVEPLVFLGPNLEVPAGSEHALYAWLDDRLLVASHKSDAVRRVAQAIQSGTVSGFVGTPFYQEIGTRYEEGAGVLAAFDLETVLRSGIDQTSADDHRAFRVFGLENARYVTFERKQSGDQTQHQVALSFRDERHGVLSWLAEPAPMGSLDFISPDAKALTALVIKDPARMLDDVDGALTGDAGAGNGFAQVLQMFQDRFGMDLRDDVAAVLGGEVAFAIDGPLVPVPSWKLIVEVYDPARFQWVVEKAVAEANKHLAETGVEPLVLRQEQVGGRTFYSLPAMIGDIDYTFVDGYLLAAPSRALLDRAIRFRDSGYTMTSSQRFWALLPHDRHENFSALFYQDMGSLLQSVIERLAPAGLSDGQQAALDAVRAEARPMLAYAYGEQDRIIAAVSSEQAMLGNALLGLFGWLSPDALERGMREGLPIP